MTAPGRQTQAKPTLQRLSLRTDAARGLVPKPGPILVINFEELELRLLAALEAK